MKRPEAESTLLVDRPFRFSQSCAVLYDKKIKNNSRRWHWWQSWQIHSLYIYNTLNMPEVNIHLGFRLV